MLAVFEKTIGKPPVEMNISSGWKVPKTRSDVPGIFREAWPQSTFYNFSNGNFMALAHPSTTAGDRPPAHPRSFVVTDDVFCIFMGNIDNISDLRRHYGLTRHTNEAMLVVEVYKVYRDRAPYPADQIIKDLTGKFAFVLFDANCGTLFTARDRHGGVKLHWGVAEDESVVFSDDGEVILDVCGISCSPFPLGCIFMNGSGLVSFDHPMHMVRAIRNEGEDGVVNGVFFQVDLYTRLASIPRVGSAANWGGGGGDAPVMKEA